MEPRFSQVSHSDTIQINKLSLAVSLGGGSKWPSTSTEKQTVSISLSIPYDLAQAAQTDDLSRTINYSSIYDALREETPKAQYESLGALSRQVSEIAFQTSPEIHDIAVRIVQLKSPLHSEAVGIESRRTRNHAQTIHDRFFCEDLSCQTIIGVAPYERVEKQTVILNVSVERSGSSDSSFDYLGLTRRLHDNVARSSYLTLEALASFIALETLCHSNGSSDVAIVRAAKPDALICAASAEVEISRHREDYPGHFETHSLERCLAGSPSSDALDAQAVAALLDPPSVSHRPLMSLLSTTATAHDSVRPGSSALHIVAISLGANVGDRFANIEMALRLLEVPHLLFQPSDSIVAVINTSFMYETAPMYVTDQRMFINCACLVETNQEPRVLLGFLKQIERVVGRTPSIRNGPRVVDLDILTYDAEILDTRDEKCRSDLNNLEGELVVPHPRMIEREFVLRPMNDMIPHFIHPVANKPIEMLLKEVTSGQLEGTPLMKKVLPFPRYPITCTSPPDVPVPSPILPVPATASYWTFPASETLPGMSPQHRIYVMATLNVTPDSFSDGSMHDSVPTAISYAMSSAAAGADIIDIGGCSTRPGATFVSSEEELARVIPVIKAIRNIPQENSKDILISVDTYRQDVAKAAVLAGANCINDVYAFTGPEYPLTQGSAEHLLSMRRLARDLAVPVVLMHSRGPAGSNKDYSMYHSAAGGGQADVLRGVQAELGDKVDAIVKGRSGVRRWLVVVDPGIGFSKTVEDNLALLRHASWLTGCVVGKGPNPLAGYPQLIGTSKKSFLGEILAHPNREGSYKGRKTEPKDRGWATAAAVACAAQQGAAVVRVHDVPEMMDVVMVSSALWRDKCG